LDGKEVSLLVQILATLLIHAPILLVRAQKHARNLMEFVIDGFHDSRSTSSPPDTIEWIQGRRTEYHTNYIRYLETPSN